MNRDLLVATGIVAFVLSTTASAQRSVAQASPRISGDTTGAACGIREAAADIQQWFVSLSIGDTAQLRRLATPALIVFSLGRNGLAEPFFRADRVDDLIAYAARRHRVRDHLLLLEIQFVNNRGRIVGFIPIFRRESADPTAVKGLWLGKAEYECGRGLRVMNLAPWPSNVPPYRGSGSRPPA